MQIDTVCVTQAELDARLLLAAEDGQAGPICALLERGADVNARRCDPPRETPLLLAVRARQVKCARLLLERGADASLADDDGVRPLLASILSGCFSKEKGRAGQVPIFGLLVQQGDSAQNPNVPSLENKSVLFFFLFFKAPVSSLTHTQKLPSRVRTRFVRRELSSKKKPARRRKTPCPNTRPPG